MFPDWMWLCMIPLFFTCVCQEQRWICSLQHVFFVLSMSCRLAGVVLRDCIVSWWCCSGLQCNVCACLNGTHNMLQLVSV